MDELQDKIQELADRYEELSVEAFRNSNKFNYKDNVEYYMLHYDLYTQFSNGLRSLLDEEEEE